MASSRQRASPTPLPWWLGQFCEIPYKIENKFLTHLFKREYENTIRNVSGLTGKEWLESILDQMKDDLKRLEANAPVGQSNVAAWQTFTASLMSLFKFWVTAMEHGLKVNSHQSDTQLAIRSNFDMMTLMFTLIRLRYEHVEELQGSVRFHPTKTNIELVEGALEIIPFFLPLLSTQILLDLSKETIQQTDKSVGISNEVLGELKSVRTELGDVGQASVQTIYNVQKLEESLLMAMEEAGNKTIYALRQDHHLQYQLLPLASPMRMDVDEVSLVPLGNGREFQADGTILPESTSLSAATTTVTASSSLEMEPSPSIPNVPTATATLPRPPRTEEDEEEKLKAQQNIMRDTSDSSGRKSGGTSRTSSVKSGTRKSILEKSPVSSSCLSLYERKMSPERPRNCEEVQLAGKTTSGVYRIFPDQLNVEHNGTEVYCDLLTDGGGWTVIQRRKEFLVEPQDFERGWEEYASGFRILHDSYWLGLYVISELTRTGDFQLRVDMTDWEGAERVAKYGYFRIANGTEQFKLFVTDYSGDAGDSLAYHNGMSFTTKDRDNDLEKNVNCAEKYHGAWWYKSCHQSNLNGLYMEEEGKGKHDSYANGVNWYSWHGYYYSLKRTEMKICSRHFQLRR